MRFLLSSMIAPVLLISFVQIANAACPAKPLVCHADFLGKDGSKVVSKTGSHSYADENEDEPSEANCAATVNISLDELDRTILRIYDDRTGHIVVIEAIQIDIEGEASYSYAKADAVLGSHLVNLAYPSIIGDHQEITAVSVSCSE